jgi:hypothetical protein
MPAPKSSIIPTQRPSKENGLFITAHPPGIKQEIEDDAVCYISRD